MGAVDRADHLCISYGFARKSVKWWRKMFFWLLEVSAVNSYILYNLNQATMNERPTTHLKFRKQLIQQLVGDVRHVGEKRGRPGSRDLSERLNKKQHFVAQ